MLLMAGVLISVSSDIFDAFSSREPVQLRSKTL
jgi:hypothetical protein